MPWRSQRMARWMICLGVVGGLALAGGVIVPHLWPGAVEPPRAEARDGVAPGRTPVQPIAIDGKQAMGYLTDLCRIGTRMSGTDGMKKQRDMIKTHFEALGAKVDVQSFEARQNSRPDQVVPMANLVVHWFPERTQRVILCTHYDTRPAADREEEFRKRQQPFLSANDGGSGVALLMELGRHMKDLHTTVGVDFVFFDGEEYVFD